jgi:Flp pilus assembly pilin Flp
MQLVRKFLKNEDGAIVAEYGLLLAMVAAVLIGVALLFGADIASWFNRNTSAITSTGV